MTDRQQSTALITLGRLPTGLDVARALYGAGWRVIVAEPYARHLAGDSRCVARSYEVTPPRADRRGYLADLEEVAAAEGVRLIVPVSEETLHVAALRPRWPVFSADRSRLLELHDKYQFNRVAAGLGLDVPPTALSDAPEAAALRASGPFVIKPRFSCSGRGVTMHARGDALSPAPNTVIQSFVDGAVVSGFALARDGQTLGSVVYRGTMMSGSVAVAFERVDDAPAADDWTRRFVAATGHSGFIAFDFVLTPDGRALAIECNPRLTSGIHFFDRASLAGAILHGTPLQPRGERRLAEKYSCLTATLGSVLSSSLPGNLRQLVTARDVTWSREDPRPFALMMRNSWPLIGRALRQRATFAEVAVQDIEWREVDGAV